MQDYASNILGNVLLTNGDEVNALPVILYIALGIAALVVLILIFNFGALWLRAFLSGAHVGILNLVGMRLRQVNPSVIVNARIMAAKAGLDLDTDSL
ncbi:MAG: hypothetical protein DRP79_05960, partial [Planctomycetota bacterium]